MFLKTPFYLFSMVILGGCALFGNAEKEITRAENYQLSLPKSWKELSSRGESDRAYQTPSGKKVVVTTYCDRNKEASLKVLTRQILIGSRNIKILQEESFSIEGGAGLFTYAQATSEGAPFFLGLAIVKKQGCVFDFSLLSQASISSSELKDFINFFKSLRYGNH